MRKFEKKFTKSKGHHYNTLSNILIIGIIEKEIRIREERESVTNMVLQPL